VKGVRGVWRRDRGMRSGIEERGRERKSVNM